MVTLWRTGRATPARSHQARPVPSVCVSDRHKRCLHRMRWAGDAERGRQSAQDRVNGPLLMPMKRSTKLWLIGGVTAAVIFFTCLGATLFWVFRSFSPHQVDEYQVSSGSLQLRAHASREGGIGLNAPGGIYRYEYRPDPQSAWTLITEFRYRTPEPIPRGQIRFVNDQCAYFFHEFVFGVTTDGGRSWTIRGKPGRSFDTLHLWAFPRIDSVTIDEGGNGVMHVSPYEWQTLNSNELTTNDFGRTWK